MKGLKGFEVFQLALALVRNADLIEKSRRHDPKLADELRRATTSIALNTAEGSGRSGRSGPHHYDIAYGSKREVEAAILIAQAWGYVAEEEAAKALEIADRLGAMLWRARGS